MYTKKVIEHFTKPHNYGKIEEADAIGEAGNPVCGDLMKIYLKVQNNVIKEIKFETLGCAAAIATSSITTDLAKGKTLTEALNISNQDVADSLQGLPPIKMHCSNLAASALHDAIKKYQKNNL
ncbi:Fe-S cluster assembly scaffold protein NifU [Patescibacteria group bacterium]|nr:Fe-S cluster assembly scaffold protein NifU [Patescibacteria group bacterium]